MKLRLAPVEETVRRAVVGDDVVLDVGAGERTLERIHVLSWNCLVGTAHQREDRRFQLAGSLRRPGRSVAGGDGSPIEPDRACETVTAGGGSQECRPPKQKPIVKTARVAALDRR